MLQGAARPAASRSCLYRSVDVHKVVVHEMQGNNRAEILQFLRLGIDQSRQPAALIDAIFRRIDPPALSRAPARYTALALMLARPLFVQPVRFC